MLRPSHHFGGWKDNSLHGRFLVWLHDLRHAFVHNTEKCKNTVKIQIFNGLFDLANLILRGLNSYIVVVVVVVILVGAC